ncbi:MAG: MBOAT family protein [Kiritimatiellae bacterium]|nr:MBOAT family protein [Kiritimatiellia bacterium]
MLFNSLAYFIFLPLVLLLYYPSPRRLQNLILLAASYVFYGWWDWRFCGLLLASTLIAYATGLAMPAAAPPRRRRAMLVISLVANLGILAFFKYFNFFIGSAGDLLAAIGFRPNLPSLRVILPVGISFYTFQTLSYTVDVYRREMPPTRSLLDFALYVSFFPQLVAGPIERATNLLHQFAAPRVLDRAHIADGAFLILLGLFRKLVIADGAAPLVDEIFASAATASPATLALGSALFALQIYGDFAGYSDIARGTASLMGFDLMVNFRQPYLSQSVSEFWRRWHISLSSWLRDYLYIPLGGNRKGLPRTYLNLFLTMLLGGLWHGASWTFVIWGALHGAYLAIHKALLAAFHRKPARHPAWTRTSLLKVLVTFVLVAFAWIFFRAPTLAAAATYVSGLFDFASPLRAPLATALPYAAKFLFFLALALGLDIPNYALDTQTSPLRLPTIPRALVYAALFLLLLLLRPLDDTPFLYFQF